jgi:hypothetical protein
MHSLESEVSLDFKQDSPVLQAALGVKLIAGIPAYPLVFTGLPMTILVFTGINDAYTGLITDASGGDTLKIKARTDYYDLTWLPAMMEWADYVNGVAKGNATIILQSGFDATKTTTDSHGIPDQMILTTVPGASGSQAIEFKSKTVVDAHAFLVIGVKTGDATIDQKGDHLEIVTNGATKIILVSSTSKSGTITGLVRKDEMDFVIAATNGAGTSSLSSKSNIIVP